MSIYNYDVLSKVIEWLPPYKRGSVMGRWVQTLVSQIEYLVYKMLVDWRLGGGYPNWIAGTYNKGTRVVYKFAVYECTTDGTTSSPPLAGWRVYNSNYIGADTRKKFTGQKVVLEYAINSYYQTTFRQPPLQSDIYITNKTAGVVGFVVGETTGSVVSSIDTAGIPEYNYYHTYSLYQQVSFLGYLYTSLTNGNTADPRDETKWLRTETIAPASPIGYTYNFVINVPSAIYNSVLPSVNYEMRQIVDTIVPESIKYIIRPY